jgi:cell division septum initiation protein DivIVA
MAKLNAPGSALIDPAEDAMAKVLRAEREARDAVERSKVEAGQLAEASRSSARAVAERTERRIRAAVNAFERELAQRLGEIDAEAALIAAPHALGADELAALGRAVRAIARELAGVRP